MSGSSPTSRRAFLATLAAAGAVACTDADRSSGPATTNATAVELLEPNLPTSPFLLGVASGDPLPDSVVLWTRLLVPPGTPAAPVRWTLRGEGGTTVQEGVAVADPAFGHSVHVDVTGLDPATHYRYGFAVGGYESPEGRTRTAPARDASIDDMRFLLANCQAFQTGYFTAYRYMAEEPDVDVVLFVGDYIYELESSVDVRPHGMVPPQDLASYRRFYEINKADADLQAAHAAFPWIMTWDDHEVEDNYAGLEPGAIGRAANKDADAQFAGKRAAAYQAWWEHVPVRLPPPDNGSLKIYRSFEWGDLAELAVLDNRQYRTPIPSGEGAGNLPRGAGGGPQLPAAFAEEATYLGREQESWLYDLLRSSTRRWNVLVQQTVMAQFDRAPADPDRGFSMDSWDGYVANRNRLLQTIVDAGLTNVVAVGGDIHSSAVTDLKLDYSSPSTATIATEFIAPSIDAIELLPEGFAESTRTNPHVHYYDTTRHGYLRCTLGRDQFQADYRYVSSTSDPDATDETGPKWTVDRDRPGAHETSNR